jgi:hypothetical protein
MTEASCASDKQAWLAMLQVRLHLIIIGPAFFRSQGTDVRPAVAKATLQGFEQAQVEVDAPSAHIEQLD